VSPRRHIALALALTLALALDPAGARAEQPEAATAKGPPPVRATTFLLPHPDIEDALAVPLMRELDEALKRNTRLEMKELDTRLAEFAQDAPQEQIDDARRLFKEGQDALNKLELPTAVKKLTEAVEALSKVLPHVKKQELADAMMALGVAEFESGDRKAARATFLKLYTWRPDYKFDPNKYPPQLLPPVEEARKEVDKARRGSCEIRSTPEAAQTYVDGRYVGVTPTFAEGLSTGEHFVTLKRAGFKKAVTTAVVSPRQQIVVEVTLERSNKYLLVEQAVASIDKQLGQATLDRAVDTLKEVLYLDHAVFVRLSHPRAGAVLVDAYLYDLRTRKQLSRIKQEISSNETGKVAPVASSLYLNVSYDAELVAPNDEAPPPKPVVRRKFYKTWWFWTATGVAAVGLVGAAVAIGVTQRPKDCGAGNICPSFTF
jgi:hypothetical protein